MDIVKWILTRLGEASTWRGLVALITAAGVTLSPDQANAVVATGLAVIGLIGVFASDKVKSKDS